MQAQLDLALLHVVRILMHIAALQSQPVAQTVANGNIEAIAVEHFDRPAVTNIALAVDKDFVIEREVPGALSKVGLIERDIDKQRVAEPRPEVQAVDPALLVAEAMP